MNAPIPSLPADLDTPRVVLDLDVVERNVERLQHALDERGVRLRPHVKTHKIVALARLQLDAGAGGVTVGTLGEAETMADGGIGDVFVAYPVWAGGPKAIRLRALHERIRLSVGVESAIAAAALGAAVAGSAEPLQVLVEIDSGGRRTGVRPEAAADVARAAQDAGLSVRGVFTHGGQAYGASAAAEGAAMDEIAALTAAAEGLEEAGITVELVSAGSTPTRVLAASGRVNEIRAGTYVLGDRQQLELGAARGDELAAWVATTVVSVSPPDRFVLDAGAKTLTKDRAPFLQGFGLLPSHPGAVIERVYDYHAVVMEQGHMLPSVGDVLAVLPNHICPVVNLVDEVLLVRAGTAVGRWTVDARGRNG